jgi:hypothetical protein
LTPSPARTRGTAATAVALLVAASLVTGCVDLGAPDWSPDGRRVVYTRVSGMRPEIRLLNVDGGEKPLLIASGAFRARWSPDGERVFFLTAGDDGAKGLRSCLPDGTDVLDHVPLGQASVSWFAPARGGGSVYYLSETDSVVYRLDLAGARAERALPEDVTCAAAALGPSGRYLACLVPLAGGAKAQGFDVRVFDLDDGSWLRQKVSLDVRGKDEAGIVPTVLFTADEREVVAFADPTSEIVSMPLQRGRTRKARVARGGASLVLKSMSREGRELHLTFAIDQGRFTSQKIDLATGRAEVLVENAPSLVGGRSWAPGGGAVAELTPMGLKVSLPDGRWEKHYPVGLEEHVRFGEHLIAAADPAMALALAGAALEDPGPDADVQRLRLLESDAHAALDNVRDSARSLYEAWLLHPVSDTPPAEVARRAAGLRHADRLVEVIRRALRGNAASRVTTLKAALPLVAVPALVAGVNFRIGEAALEAGDAKEAGKRFRLASEAADFPAADYAAGLAGVAHYVAGRDRYAAELLMKAVDLFPTSVLQDDLREALRQAQDPAMAVLRRTQDANHPSRLAAWGAIHTVRSASWSLKPTLGGGRRILVEVSYNSTVYVARAEERARPVLSGVRADLGSFAFAPSGRLLAFVAAGAGGQAAYVIDLAGRIVSGDAAALTAAGPEGGEIVMGVAWDDDGKALIVEVALPDGTTEQRQLEMPKPAAAPAADRRAPPANR